MSDGLNRVILLGNLGADPELRYTQNGTAVLSMRLATNETFLDKNKEPQERTDWHAVVLWGSRAEALAKQLSKGTCLLVEGGLRTSSYEKDGQKRYKTEVYAKEICFTTRRPQPTTSTSTSTSTEVEDEVIDRVLAAAPPGMGLASGAGSAARPPVRSAAPRVKPREVVDEIPY